MALRIDFVKSGAENGDIDILSMARWVLSIVVILITVVGVASDHANYDKVFFCMLLAIWLRP